MPVGARFEHALSNALTSSCVSGSAGNFRPLFHGLRRFVMVCLQKGCLVSLLTESAIGLQARQPGFAKAVLFRSFEHRAVAPADLALRLAQGHDSAFAGIRNAQTFSFPSTGIGVLRALGSVRIKHTGPQACFRFTGRAGRPYFLATFRKNLSSAPNSQSNSTTAISRTLPMIAPTTPCPRVGAG